MTKTYDYHSDYYASKCSACKGDKKILKDGRWFRCGCQFFASLDWRFQQTEIIPESLKKMSWKDFDGCVRKGNAISSCIDQNVILESRSKAMKYCFGSDSMSVLLNRKKYSQIKKRSESGENVVIVGKSGTGKTMLATLILKEVVLYCSSSAADLTFEWINASELLHACRWDTQKRVNHDYIDECIDPNFLFIDNLDVPTDYIASLDRLTNSRMINRRPCVITCDLPFWNGCMQKPSLPNYETIVKRLGKSVVGMITNTENTVILL